MKKLFFIIMLLVATTAIYAFGSVSEDTVENTAIEYRTETDQDGMTTCYARSCVLTSDNDGNEYKECSDWEEVDCDHIRPAQ